MLKAPLAKAGMQTARQSLLLAAFCAVVFASSALADSYWDHNGSLMRLQADGMQRVFTYEEPRALMRRAGVTAGTVLFDGRNVGDYYIGRARRFSKYCESPLVYEVEGPVTDNGMRIVMRGEREVYAKGCQPTGRFVEDVLVFTYEWSD
ncbi:hypothetical protein [Dichotomicrobium thermohalophilum]|uniref:Uncharacterized protein n=1 Tax=Dichotomicrobium thermohalophilum TaxID=933063 RepID=A0A397PFV6_9HYPH|nr:hypothetical protein [Dichotomicrobium thermohalophilum]RIA47343.1 hypothetical protein BXY53_2420 [Dichotomicrobium thermohalophilum]